MSIGQAHSYDIYHIILSSLPIVLIDVAQLCTILPTLKIVDPYICLLSHVCIMFVLIKTQK